MCLVQMSPDRRLSLHGYLLHTYVSGALCTVASDGGLEIKKKISPEDPDLSITCQGSQQRSSKSF